MKSVSFTRFQTQRGAAAIEAVFLLPIFFLLFFALIHYSLIFMAKSLFEHAANEGIRASVSMVNQSCYFRGIDCDDDTTLAMIEPEARSKAGDAIRAYTNAEGASLGSLFGTSLPDDLIGVEKISGGGCCVINVDLDYTADTHFIPAAFLDGLLPDQISANASMRLN